MSRLADKFSPHQPSSSSTEKAPANQNTARYESIVFKKKNGELWSFPFMHLVRTKLVDDRTTLKLIFTDCTIAIKGVRLLSVFHDIRLHRICELEESHSEFDQELSDDPIIQSIEEIA